MLLKDLLEVEIPDEITHVIDVQNTREEIVESEISVYIVTNSLAKNYLTLAQRFNSLEKETGVWLSGFYGSGKSYFAKVFGQLLENRTIKGTPFIERFFARLHGLQDAALIENEIRGLAKKHKTHIVYIDIGKKGVIIQNGLSYTLFKSLLHSLGFMTDKYGFVEFELYLNNDLDNFKKGVESLKGMTWEEVKNNHMMVAPVMKQVFEKSFPGKYTNDSIQRLEDTIKSFSPDLLAELIKNYLKISKTDRLIFIVDEVSESVALRKIDLLDLQGVTESLSSVGAGKVWTFACAQEKLDDVLRNSGSSMNELSKVQDRFKTRLHLSSNDVNEVIEERL
ncbi:MAG: hypothetical protein P4L45_15395, partial [Ignavibacteriaceae bacterium]|nr:hypothetical protein [Ignavibacteriaceae bacterium]